MAFDSQGLRPDKDITLVRSPIASKGCRPQGEAVTALRGYQAVDTLSTRTDTGYHPAAAQRIAPNRRWRSTACMPAETETARGFVSPASGGGAFLNVFCA